MPSLLLAVLLASSASAALWGPFDHRQFEAARQSGSVVLLHFTERGCSSCAEQEKILSRMFWDSPRKDWVGFQVQLERDGDFARQMGAEGRSTLILLRGAREIGRSVGMILESELAAFLRRADAPEPRGRPLGRPGGRRPLRP